MARNKKDVTSENQSIADAVYQTQMENFFKAMKKRMMESGLDSYFILGKDDDSVRLRLNSEGIVVHSDGKPITKPITIKIDGKKFKIDKEQSFESILAELDKFTMGNGLILDGFLDFEFAKPQKPVETPKVEEEVKEEKKEEPAKKEPVTTRDYIKAASDSAKNAKNNQEDMKIIDAMVSSVTKEKNLSDGAKLAYALIANENLKIYDKKRWVDKERNTAENAVHNVLVSDKFGETNVTPTLLNECVDTYIAKLKEDIVSGKVDDMKEVQQRLDDLTAYMGTSLEAYNNRIAQQNADLDKDEADLTAKQQALQAKRDRQVEATRLANAVQSQAKGDIAKAQTATDELNARRNKYNSAKKQYEEDKDKELTGEELDRLAKNQQRILDLQEDVMGDN